MSNQAGRYNRSFPGMIGAMVVCLLAIAAFVAFRAGVRDELEITRQPIEWGSSVRFAQEQGFDVAWPSAVPEDWIVHHVDLAVGQRPIWALSMLTDKQEYVGIRQEVSTVDKVVAALVDERAAMGEPVTLDAEISGPWSTFTDDGGDYAVVTELTGEHEGQVLIVFGTGDEQAIRDLAGSLTFAAY